MFKKTLSAALAAATLCAALVPTLALAQRDDRHGDRHDGGGNAVAAGALGLALGAALAGDGRPYYGHGQRYYGGPPPGAYAGPAYYSYSNGCRSHYRWSERRGAYVMARNCY